MNKKLGTLALYVLAMASLASCATSGSHQAVDPITEKIGLFDKVDLKITSQVSDADEGTISTVQEQIMKALQPRFAPSSQDGKKWPGTLGLELEITDFNRVSSGARFILGPLAGKDRVAVKGTLIDVVTGKKIGTFTALAENSGSGLQIGDAGVIKASMALGDQISTYLTKENM